MARVCLPVEMLNLIEFDWRVSEIEEIYKRKYGGKRLFVFDKNPPLQKLPKEFESDPALKWRLEGLVKLYLEEPREFLLNFNHAGVPEYVLMPDLDHNLFPVVEVPAEPEPEPEPPAIDDCGICASGYEEGERVALVLLCGHFFHWACLTRWLDESLTCPYCRTDVEPAGSIGSCSAREASAYTVPRGQARNDLLFMQAIASEGDQLVEQQQQQRGRHRRHRRRNRRHEPY